MNTEMYRVAVIIAMLCCFPSGQHLNAEGNLAITTSFIAYSGVIPYFVSSSIDKSNPETEYENPRTIDDSGNLPRYLPTDELVGAVLHQIDSTVDSLLFPPHLESTITSTLLTQTVTMELQTVISCLSDNVTVLNTPRLQQGDPHVMTFKTSDTALTHPMETTAQVTTTTVEGNRETDNFYVNMPLPTESSLSGTTLTPTTTGVTATDGIWLSSFTPLPDCHIGPSENRTSGLELVTALNVTYPGISGTTIPTAPATSKGGPRNRSKYLSLSFILFAASVFLGRDKPDRHPPGYRSPDSGSTTTSPRRARKPRQPGWKERSLVIHGLDHNESVLAALERDTPVSDYKQEEVYVMLVPYGEIIEITFLNQNEAVVEWDDQKDARRLMELRRKPKYYDREVGTVWYNRWGEFCQAREDDVTREKAAAILRRAQAALKNVVIRYESEEATDLLDQAEEALERAQEQQEEEDKRIDGQPEGSKRGEYSAFATADGGKVRYIARVDGTKSEDTPLWRMSKGKGVDKGEEEEEEDKTKFPESDASKERTMASAFMLLRRAQNALKNNGAIAKVAEAQKALREEARESKIVQAAELLSEARETLMREAGAASRGVNIPIPDAEAAEGDVTADTPSPDFSSSLLSDEGGDVTAKPKSLSSSGGEEEEEEERRGRTRTRAFERYEMALLQS